jgi:nicotinate-nucleotide adenylyltransferase
MPTWRDPERIFATCTVAVVERPDRRDAAPQLVPPAARYERVSGPGLAISATEVRQRVREGRSVRYLVPDAVADYIAKRGLYR